MANHNIKSSCQSLHRFIFLFRRSNRNSIHSWICCWWSTGETLGRRSKPSSSWQWQTLVGGCRLHWRRNNYWPGRRARSNRLWSPECECGKLPCDQKSKDSWLSWGWWTLDRAFRTFLGWSFWCYTDKGDAHNFWDNNWICETGNFGIRKLQPGIKLPPSADW